MTAISVDPPPISTPTTYLSFKSRLVTFKKAEIAPTASSSPGIILTGRSVAFSITLTHSSAFLASLNKAVETILIFSLFFILYIPCLAYFIFMPVATFWIYKKPKVYIENFGGENNKIEIFHSEYTGIFEPGEDKTERPYSYKFSLYNYNLELVETSGWQLHNTTINNIASESMSLEKTTDIYNFNTNIKFDTEYYL